MGLRSKRAWTSGWWCWWWKFHFEALQSVPWELRNLSRKAPGGQIDFSRAAQKNPTSSHLGGHLLVCFFRQVHSRLEWFLRKNSGNLQAVLNCFRTPIPKFLVFNAAFQLGAVPHTILTVTRKNSHVPLFENSNKVLHHSTLVSTTPSFTPP